MRDFFDVPLKEGAVLPCLKYDIALYCREMDKAFPKNPPEYLSIYAANIKLRAVKAMDYRPDSFSEHIRVYIFDSRMRTLFAMLDQAKDDAWMMYDYAQGGFAIEDYFFGFGTAGMEEGQNLERFVMQYQFIPNDFLAFNHLALFFQDTFIASAHLSAFQTTILLERYREKNLVDIKDWAKREF